jgi:hypothetical protein
MADDLLIHLDETAKARFWAKVDIRGENECWPWRGATDGRYGLFYLRRRNLRATLVSLSMHLNAVRPNGSVTCHACDNPICVNPKHLWWGTMRENALDAVSKGRVDIRKAMVRNHNTEKNECIRGHSLSGDNLRIRVNKTGESRLCRQCARIHDRRYSKLKRVRQAMKDTAP